MSLVSGYAVYVSFEYTIIDSSPLIYISGTVFAIICYLIIRYNEPKLYASLMHLCEFCLKRKKVFFLLCACISICLLGFFAKFILQDFPNSGDEYCYLYQAKTFLEGRLWNAPHKLQHFFDFFHIWKKEGKLVSIFPPGWPLVLSLFMLLRFPLWLINPLLGTISLAVIYLLGKKLYNERVACLTVITTAVSSFFLFNSASYFSHTLCSLLVLSCVFFYIRFLVQKRPVDASLSGIFFGAAFITRPGTTLLFVLPAAIYFFYRRTKDYKKYIYVIFGIIPFFCFFLYYNFKITGNPLLPPLFWIRAHKYNSLWLPFNLYTSRKITFQRLVDFVRWTPPFILPIYFVIYLRSAFQRKKTDFTGLIFLTFMIGVFFYRDQGGNQYGPRYYYEALPFLVLFVVSAIFSGKPYSQQKYWEQVIFRMFMLSIVISFPVTLLHLGTEKKVILERRNLYRKVEEKRIKNAIIFLKTGTGKQRYMWPGDLVRNDFKFQNDVLYVHDLKEKNKELMDYYKDRDFYLYYYDQKNGKGHLRPYNYDY